MKNGHETEQQRCHRQRKEAIALVKSGNLDRESFDWYERTYWCLHDPIKTTDQANQGNQ